MGVGAEIRRAECLLSAVGGIARSRCNDNRRRLALYHLGGEARPDKATTVARGDSSSTTSVIRQRVVFSSPLLATTTGACAGSDFRAVLSMGRRTFDGVANVTSSAPLSTPRMSPA